MSDSTHLTRRARIKNTWGQFRSSKFGLVGIAIILFFSVLALVGPLTTPYNPVNGYHVSGDYAVPSWARIFPQYSDYPLNHQFLTGTSLNSSAALQAWQISTSGTGGTDGGSVSYSPTTNGLLANFTQGSQSGFSFSSSGPALILNQTVHYPWSYACTFQIGLALEPIGQNLSTSDLTLNIYAHAPSGRSYHILDQSVYASSPGTSPFIPSFPANVSTQVYSDSSQLFVLILATGNSAGSHSLGACGIASGVFSGQGDLTISYVIASTVNASIIVSHPYAMILGRSWGLLGTDYEGRDVWSQFVNGARISLTVGLVAALVAIVIGTLVGLVAGFLGGFVDEILMRFTDFFLTLPFLPLLLAILGITEIGHITIISNSEELILLLIGFLGWPGTARILRSQVLSVKQRQFVEASRALGANSSHVIRRHIFPNVLGLIYANLALTVPAAILTEAALTFLGFGNPNLISWGEMLSLAQAGLSANLGFVWWWFIPPGLAIAVLSMSFVFLGFSLDSIFNPKFRRR
jgi:peptide/nickel transport system permease protein